MPQPTPPRRTARLAIALVAFAFGLAVVLLGGGSGRPAGAAEAAPTPTTVVTTAAPTTVKPVTTTSAKAPATTVTTTKPATAPVTTVAKAPATTAKAPTTTAKAPVTTAPRTPATTARPAGAAPTTVAPTTVPVADANGIVTPPALLVDGPVDTAAAAKAGGLGPFVKLYGAAAALALAALLCGFLTLRYWWHTRPGSTRALHRAAAERPTQGVSSTGGARTGRAIRSTRGLAASTAAVARTPRPLRRAATTTTTGWGADRDRPTRVPVRDRGADLDRTAEYDLVL